MEARPLQTILSKSQNQGKREPPHNEVVSIRQDPQGEESNQGNSNFPTSSSGTRESIVSGTTDVISSQARAHTSSHVTQKVSYLPIAPSCAYATAGSNPHYMNDKLLIGSYGNSVSQISRIPSTTSGTMNSSNGGQESSPLLPKNFSELPPNSQHALLEQLLATTQSEIKSAYGNTHLSQDTAKGTATLESSLTSSNVVSLPSHSSSLNMPESPGPPGKNESGGSISSSNNTLVIHGSSSPDSPWSHKWGSLLHHSRTNTVSGGTELTSGSSRGASASYDATLSTASMSSPEVLRSDNNPPNDSIANLNSSASFLHHTNQSINRSASLSQSLSPADLNTRDRVLNYLGGYNSPHLSNISHSALDQSEVLKHLLQANSDVSRRVGSNTDASRHSMMAGDSAPLTSTLGASKLTCNSSSCGSVHSSVLDNVTPTSGYSSASASTQFSLNRSGSNHGGSGGRDDMEFRAPPPAYPHSVNRDVLLTREALRDISLGRGTTDGAAAPAAIRGRGMARDARRDLSLGPDLTRRDAPAGERKVSPRGEVPAIDGSLSRSQPDLSRVGGGDAREVQLSERLDPSELPTVVDLLYRENTALRLELELVSRKVHKLQKFESDIVNMQTNHESLVQSCARREQLEKLARTKLQSQVQLLTRANVDLKEELDALRARDSNANASYSGRVHEGDESLRRELNKRDVIVAQLVAQNKELLAAKERLQMEVAAQKKTLNEQRSHIDVLDSALGSARSNVTKLEEEVRVKQDNVTELQQAAAADRRQQLQADQEMRIQQQMLLLQYAKDERYAEEQARRSSEKDLRTQRRESMQQHHYQQQLNRSTQGTSDQQAAQQSSRGAAPRRDEELDSSDGCGDSNGNSTTIADGRPGTASIDDSTCTKTGTAERTVMNTGTAEGMATKTRTTEGTATKTGAPKGTAPNTSGAEGTTTKTDASALPILHIHEVDSNTQLTDCTEDQSLQHRTSPCLSVETQLSRESTSESVGSSQGSVEAVVERTSSSASDGQQASDAHGSSEPVSLSGASPAPIKQRTRLSSRHKNGNSHVDNSRQYRRSAAHNRSRTPDGQRHTPDTQRHSPDTQRHTPDTHRHSPDAYRYIPETQRHTPETQRHTPETQRHTPETQRHTPETQRYTPETQRHTPETHRHTPYSHRYTPETHRYTPDTQRYTPDTQRHTPDTQRNSVEPESVARTDYFRYSCEPEYPNRRVRVEPVRDYLPRYRNDRSVYSPERSNYSHFLSRQFDKFRDATFAKSTNSKRLSYPIQHDKEQSIIKNDYRKENSSDRCSSPFYLGRNTSPTAPPTRPCSSSGLECHSENVVNRNESMHHDYVNYCPPQCNRTSSYCSPNVKNSCSHPPHCTDLTCCSTDSPYSNLVELDTVKMPDYENPPDYSIHRQQKYEMESSVSSSKSYPTQSANDRVSTSIENSRTGSYSGASSHLKVPQVRLTPPPPHPSISRTSSQNDSPTDPERGGVSHFDVYEKNVPAIHRGNPPPYHSYHEILDSTAKSNNYEQTHAVFDSSPNFLNDSNNHNTEMLLSNQSKNSLTVTPVEICQTNHPPNTSCKTCNNARSTYRKNAANLVRRASSGASLLKRKSAKLRSSFHTEVDLDDSPSILSRLRKEWQDRKGGSKSTGNIPTSSELGVGASQGYLSASGSSKGSEALRFELSAFSRSFSKKKWVIEENKATDNRQSTSEGSYVFCNENISSPFIPRTSRGGSSDHNENEFHDSNQTHDNKNSILHASTHPNYLETLKAEHKNSEPEHEISEVQSENKGHYYDVDFSDNDSTYDTLIIKNVGELNDSNTTDGCDCVDSCGVLSDNNVKNKNSSILRHK